MTMKNSIHYTDENLDPGKVSTLLAREMNKLSVYHRTSIDEEIHGVSCMAPKETPTLLKKSLDELSSELVQIRPADKRGYMRSQELFRDNKFVDGEGFRLMFLRCEFFDAKRAALRMVRYLDFVLEVFDGKKELLRRQIRLEDLGTRATKLLRTGCLQLLPVRDNSGRRVFVVIAFPNHEAFEVIDRVQLYMYFQTVLSEDIENQRKGIVSLAMPGEHGHKIKKLPNREDRYLLNRYISANPVRFCAIHSCYPDTTFHRLARAAYSLAMYSTESIRFRTKFHLGTETEARYLLLGYGIPQGQIPLTSGGKVKTGSILQWINTRSMIEKKMVEAGCNTIGECNVNIIDCPGFNDVAMRPGKAYLCHPGNVKFKQLLDDYVDEYTNGNRNDKDRIAWEIIKIVQGWNGRFLEWNNSSSYWVANYDAENIRSKIPIYIRDHKRNIKSHQKLQSQKLKRKMFSSQPLNECGGVGPYRLYDKKARLNEGTHECNFNCLLQTV